MNLGNILFDLTRGYSGYVGSVQRYMPLIYPDLRTKLQQHAGGTFDRKAYLPFDSRTY